MPFTLKEANTLFQRQVEREKIKVTDAKEAVDALMMGTTIVNALFQRTEDLEKLLRANKIPLPGEQPIPDPEM